MHAAPKPLFLPFRSRNLTRTLILGYGNPDRQDDGVAWHILTRVAKALNRDIPSSYEDGLEPDGHEPDLFFLLQLTPELAEIIMDYDRVCFIDAHTGSMPDDLSWTKVDACYQPSPLTHHLTPSSLLCLVDNLYHRQPEGVLVSVRGFKFDFAQTLSPQTSLLAKTAAEKILVWLQAK